MVLTVWLLLCWFTLLFLKKCLICYLAHKTINFFFSEKLRTFCIMAKISHSKVGIVLFTWVCALALALVPLCPYCHVMQRPNIHCSLSPHPCAFVFQTELRSEVPVSFLYLLNKGKQKLGQDQPGFPLTLGNQISLLVGPFNPFQFIDFMYGPKFSLTNIYCLLYAKYCARYIHISLYLPNQSLS